MVYRRMSRRMFLQGLGSSLAIPLLPSLLPKALAATIQPPIRFVAITVNNGQNQDRWFPWMDATNKYADDVYWKSLGEIITAKGQISEFLGPEFNSLQNKISILRGLDATTGPDKVHSSSVPLGGSNMVDPGSVNSFPFFPYTIDAVMENSATIYPMNPKVRALRLCPNESGGAGTTSYSWDMKNGVATKLSTMASAQDAFNKLFTGSTPMPTPENALAKRQGLVIDAVKEDFNRVINNRQISSVDKTKLQNYADLISDLQKKILATAPADTSVCVTPQVSSPTSQEKLYSIHFDVVVAALACQLTRVVTLHMDHWGTNDDWAYYHSQSHSNTGDAWKTYSRWRAIRVAELMTKMNAMADIGGNTLLDNSMVLWTNELGDGSQHQPLSIPVLIGGGAGGKLRTGVYIDYRQKPPIMCANEWVKIGLGRPYNELLVTMLQTMGMTPAEYQRDGKTGFGDYEHMAEAEFQYLRKYTLHREYPLPYYFKG